MRPQRQLAANVQASDSVTKGKVTFDGQMSGLTDSLIVLKADNNSFTRLDTVLVKDGKFHFTVSLDQPTDLYIYSPGTLRHTERIGFTAIAVPVRRPPSPATKRLTTSQAVSSMSNTAPSTVSPKRP